MPKIKENIDNGIDDKLKRFDVIMNYSLLDKIKFVYIKIVRALIEGNLPVKFRSK